MKIQIFYDYECPFCKKGYENLMDLLPAYPQTEILWRPVEAHPRPEMSWPHTDLCIQAFYIAEELGADMNAFHRIMFQKTAIERLNVEKGGVIAEILKEIVDSRKFLDILKSGKYRSMVDENNDLAYEKSEAWYLPAFRIPGGDQKTAPKLDARGGEGVTRNEIGDFLKKANSFE